jgi:hypothetical protein
VQPSIQPSPCDKGYGTFVYNDGGSPIIVDYEHFSQAELILGMRGNKQLAVAIRNIPAILWPAGESVERRLEKLKTLNDSNK